MNHDPYFWTSIFEPQHLKIDGVDFSSSGAPTVGYAFSLLYDVNRLLRRARRETIGAFHGLHLKRVIRHVIVSSGTTDKKVVVPIVDLAKLAKEQADKVYRQHCVQLSDMTMDQITKSFADNGCQTITDIKNKDGVISEAEGGAKVNCEYFRFYPEVVGCGEKTLWTSVISHSPSSSGQQLQQNYSDAANEATYILDDWLGDDLIYAQRSYLVTGRYLEILENESVTGFKTTKVSVIKSGKFPQIDSIAKAIEKTEFFRLDFVSGSDCDLFLVPHVAVNANARAVNALAKAKLRYALFIQGGP